MLSIKINEDKKTEIELKGNLERIMDDAINIIGHLVNQVELIGGPNAMKAFVAAIPQIILKYQKDLKSGKYESLEQVVSQTKEAVHENDTL